MPVEIQGQFAWPGLEGGMSLSYTTSQGSMPGIIQIKAWPQASFPQQYGDVVITDGISTTVIPRCRLNTIRAMRGANGVEWNLEIVDRRWQWRNFGFINGYYNQLDPHGKLIPRYIRSPYELAVLCLEAMGEFNYLIDMPFGLSQQDGEGMAENFLKLGQEFPQTATNPPINWRSESPINALCRLCDMLGRRLIYDHITDSVVICKVGEGRLLPDGHIETEGPSLKSPEIPDVLIVEGSESRYQVRLPVEPVGLEWNGEYRPIDLLSYAPRYDGQSQQLTLTIRVPADAQRPVANFQYHVAMQLSADNIEEVVVIVDAVEIDATAGVTANAILDTIRGYLLANENVARNVILTLPASGDPLTATMTFTAKGFDVSMLIPFHAFRSTLGDPFDLGHTSTVANVRVARRPGRGWQYTDPFDLANVVTTDRLNLEQARDLAKKSVWKCYRVTGQDATGVGWANIPGYGRIQFLQQLILTQNCVEQITPSDGDANLLNKLGEPFIDDLYNGYSRDSPAKAFGSVYRYGALAKFTFVNTTDANTPEGTEIFIPYSVDPIKHVCTFSAPVFKLAAGQYQKPEILVQMAVNIRDPETYQVVCYRQSRPLVNGVLTGTQPRVYKHADVQLNVVSEYDDNGLFSFRMLELDPISRASHYLDNHSLEYFLASGMTRTYNGLVLVPLDGAVAQVSYEINERGINTKASRNTEHVVWAPDYPARRRVENLDGVLREQIDTGRKTFAIEENRKLSR